MSGVTSSEASGIFLKVKKFPFPAYRNRRAGSKEQGKREVFKGIKKKVTRSFSVVKGTRNGGLPNALPLLQEYPCKSAKLIRPVSVSFFNTQFGKKKTVVRPFTPIRRIPKPPPQHIKLNPKDYIKSVRLSTQESLSDIPGIRALKELKSVYSEECKSSNRRVKVKVQAWIPLPTQSTN
jgi:hypothetical protein